MHVETASEPLTEYTGALLLQEAAELLGLPELFDLLLDRREPDRFVYPLSELLLTRTLQIAPGWPDQDDGDLLRQDPALRAAVSAHTGDRVLQTTAGPQEPEELASQPPLSQLQGMLASTYNRRILSEIVLTLA